jgi:hypothetical protein
MGKLYEKDTTGRSTLLTRVRASFAESLQEKKPHQSDPTKLSHGANFILERGSPDFESNKAAIAVALQNTCKEAKRPENWWRELFDDDPKQLAFRKGERFKEKKTSQVYKGYENNLIVVGKGPKAGAERPGKLLDRYKRPIEVKDINEVIYNGTLCDVVISWYYTDKHGPARITCSIEAVRSWQEGERLGGGGLYVDEDDFDTIEGDDDGFDAPPKTQTSSSFNLLDF